MALIFVILSRKPVSRMVKWNEMSVMMSVLMALRDVALILSNADYSAEMAIDRNTDDR